MSVVPPSVSTRGQGKPSEVFLAFLRLGLSAFGGPIAHLGYFRTEFVTRRRWIDEQGYGELLGLCHFLPGPTSSQMGFILGIARAGQPGGLAAWAGFTLPSAILMTLFALGVGRLHGALADGVLHGLKLTAVAVVAQAVWGMARNLTPDQPRIAIALLILALTLLGGWLGNPLFCIVIGGLLGLSLRIGAAASDEPVSAISVSPRGAAAALSLFSLIFGLSLVPTAGLSVFPLFATFFHAGALVFGGGHVVLPLLQTALVQRGWINGQDFLAGYGLVQAMPGPLFTFASYLGAVIAPAGGKIAGAIVALLGLFLPGLLLVYGMLPFWNAVRHRAAARAALAGTNAAVVGLLGAALYTPIWTSTVTAPRDFVLAVIGFFLLVRWRIAPWCLVLLMAAAGALCAVWP